MTTGFAHTYGSLRMLELGYGSDCAVRLRHLVILPKEQRVIDAKGSTFFLTETDEFSTEVSVVSYNGKYHRNNPKLTEQQFEHRGEINVINPTKEVQEVRFLQFIPKHQPHE